jgi:hypothetical protein
MAKIILTVDGTVLKEVSLIKERVTIGRRPLSDMMIDHVAISGEHAVIVTQFNDSVVEDLNSTNGTHINGQPIKKHVLQDNDIIDLAPYKIKFIAGTTGSDSDVAQQPLATIKVLNGQCAGKEMSLTKPLTTIGRPGVQVAVVTYRKHGYFVTHVEGRSFPLVNGDSIGGNACLLKVDDVIDLSGTRMVFSCPDSV